MATITITDRDLIQLNSKPKIFLIIAGKYVNSLANPRIKRLGKYEAIGAFETKSRARQELPALARLYGYHRFENSDCYSDGLDGYLRIEAIQFTANLTPKSRDKHPLSTRIVRG